MRPHRRFAAAGVRGVAFIVALVLGAVLAAPASAAPGWRFETLDGDGGRNGRTTDAVADYNAVTVWKNEPHVFYFDATVTSLRHAWWNGTAWTFETLDGDCASCTNGRVNSDVGTHVAATVWNNQPHVFYADTSAGTLRHGWWTGTRWRFEALDGTGVAGGNGRTANPVGFDNAVVVWNSQPHVFYRSTTTFNLRHAWWNGSAWFFENLDGNGVPGGNGRTADSVGMFDTATVWNGEPHLWYFDDTAGRLRHGWWNGAAWFFENLDGNGVPGGNGRVAAEVGLYNATTIWSNQPHVFYHGASNGRLRHGWWTGTKWQFEDLDGYDVPGGNGRVFGNVGTFNAATTWNDEPHVWYHDNSNARLRHGWWNGAAWLFEALDGVGVPGGNGRVDSEVGMANAVTVWNAQPHDFYQDGRDGTWTDLRHAWYASQ